MRTRQVPLEQHYPPRNEEVLTFIFVVQGITEVGCKVEEQRCSI